MNPVKNTEFHPAGINASAKGIPCYFMRIYNIRRYDQSMNLLLKKLHKPLVRAII